jgi:raffinose/stachyose/melibiose transport system permease protein
VSEVRTTGTAAVTAAVPAATAGGRARRAKPARLLSRPSKIAMWAGLLLGIVVYILFGIGPMIGNIIISFTDYTQLAWATTHIVGFTNYAAMFSSQSSAFDQAIVATIIFTIGVTVGQNALGLLLAHKLIGESKWAAVGRMLVFVPIALGVTVVGLVWILIFDPAQGPMTSFFGLFGIHSAFLGADDWALGIVILVQIWQNAGFSTLVFIGGLRSIDPSLYEAADMDGIGGWKRLTRITFPLLAPSVTANVMLALVGAFTTYNLIYVLTGGGSSYGTQTLGMLAFNDAFGTNAETNLGFGAAVTVALFVFTLIIATPVLLYLRGRERRLLG